MSRWIFVKNAALWAPSDLADLRCWLDAADSATITESSGSISLWEDKAGSNDADDAVNTSNAKITTARPTVVASAQNGLNAVGFNGSQWFDHNSARGMLRNRSCALMALTMKYGAVSNSTFQFAWANRDGVDAGDNRLRFQTLHFDSNAVGVSSARLDADSGITLTESSNPPYNTNWHVHVAVLDWADDSCAYYIDGTLVGTAAYPSGGANTSDTELGTDEQTWTAIGASRRRGAYPLSNNSRIGELICGAKGSGSYATGDREKLEGYLAHKWGLESNLPAGHPYKTTAPTV